MTRSLLSLSSQRLIKVSGLSVFLSASLVTSSIGLATRPVLAVPVEAEPEIETMIPAENTQQLVNPALETTPICVKREKLVKAGDWRTLESYFNATGHAFFQGPAGAEIKVRYGAGSIFGKDRQKQKLDGYTIKKLEIGIYSVFYARMQMKVPKDSVVYYYACSGGVAKQFPEQKF